MASRRYPSVSAIISLCVGSVFVGQLLLGPPHCSTGRYPALCSARLIFEWNPGVGFLVAPLLHGSWVHLLSNLGMIGVFGWVVEDAIPRDEFLLLCAVTAYLGLSVQVGWEVLAGRGVPLIIGVSGLAYGLAGCTAATSVRHIRPIEGRVVSNGRVRMTIGLFGTLIILATVGQVVFGIIPSGTSAALAHLVGAAIGVAWGLLTT